MTQKFNVIILSIDHWLSGLLYSAAALSRLDHEIFWVNPGRVKDEIAALKLLAARLPVTLTDATGDPAFAEALRLDAELAALTPEPALPADPDPGRLLEHFGPARGVVTAPSADPARCLQAAVLAVRLGYLFLPAETPVAPSPLPAGLPLIRLGRESEQETAGRSASRPVTYIPDSPALAAFMQRQTPPPDYLLLYNSDDINGRPAPYRSMGDYRVRGLSLLAPLCASYRRVFPYDACAAQPDPMAIEEKLNRFVASAGLQPKYLATLASPGVIPFIYDPRLTIGSRSEEMAREIHLRLNDDLFFDLAEGRLFQSTPGGLSLQLISSKHYHRIAGAGRAVRAKNAASAGTVGGTRNTAGADRAADVDAGSGTAAGAKNRVLVVTTPHVEGGIIFTSDEPVIECQLKPLLEEAGYGVDVLAGESAHCTGITAALQQSDFFLYTGHGGPETLHTHGRFLSRRELPPLPPLVAFASACSTAAVDPHWYSTTDGLDWEHIPVSAPETIGLAMVEKGAVCFVGGTTTEDLQYSTSVYGIFMEALLVRGCSVGEAVRELRNFISLFALMFEQKSPEGYRCYKQGTANAIHQQLLLGDPALVPCPQLTAGDTALTQVFETAPGRRRLRVTIPEERWRRLKRAVSPLPPSKYYYRSRAIEAITPFGEGVISWGDYYRVAPDAEGITENAVISAYLYLHLDLPPGEHPLRLSLIEVKAAGSECLLCGKEADPPADLKEAFQDFRIPYLLLPPSRLDMRSGWAYTVEERGPGEGLRVHWLVPALVIDDATRTAVRASEFAFEVETAAEQRVSGRVAAPPGNPDELDRTYLISAATAAEDQADAGSLPGTAPPETPLNIARQTLTRPEGVFEFTCAASATLLTVSEQFPLYDLAEPYRTFEKERLPLPLTQPEIQLYEVTPGEVRGKVLDSRSGASLPGVLLRVWRGGEDPVGDPLIEGFAVETCSDAAGAFAFSLPAGKYTLSAVARPDGVQYKSKTINIEVLTGDDQHLLLPLDAAAVVSGSIKCSGPPLPHPVVVVLNRFPEKGGGEIIVSTPAQPDGTFSCLVSFQDRFYVWIEEEGRQPIKDYNEGRGYKLEPGEELQLDYTLRPLG